MEPRVSKSEELLLGHVGGTVDLVLLLRPFDGLNMIYMYESMNVY